MSVSIRNDRAFAHTHPSGLWEPLEKHLTRVAGTSAGLASSFNSEAWARLAGLWHDLGKFRPEFQSYLRGELPSGGEHAGLGAALAVERGSPGAWPLAFAIAGHHAGLANRESNTRAEDHGLTTLPTPLTDRLRDNAPLLATLRPTLPSHIVNAPLPPLPPFLADLASPLKDRATKNTAARMLAFWTRMLFSALVDSDRLETARFYAQYTPALQHDDLRTDDLLTLRNRLDAHIDALAANPAPTPVSPLRAEILRACRERAALPPGRFSLTVPTGGGKTLAAMSFALNHSHPTSPEIASPRHRRVIVVIPFTSIIEQNAAVYRDVLGDTNVLEHHSNLDESTLSERDPDREARRKLAAENWDAPIIVTTTVQFFESLFSNHPSRCRKLHNIARSIIILDEVQTLPPQLLTPILHALAELTDRYGCTIVLSTATPPALARSDAQPHGLANVTEIIPDPASLAKRARRVRVRWEIDKPTAYTDLAERLAKHPRVLAIVHRRRDARELAAALQARAGADGLFHLSALMCPAHRLDVLTRVRAALKAGAPCRLVSTQLIEAGVDVDFPVVYRALAGLDSLAQAAGRCDREGRLTAARGGEPGGELIVFRAPTPPPLGVLTKAYDSVVTLRGLRGDLDPFDPATCLDFFRALYEKHDLDGRAVMPDLAKLDFANAAAKFRMIDSASVSIVVPYGDAERRLAAYRKEPSILTRRALQSFTIQINPHHHAKLHAAGVLETIDEAVASLPLCAGRYSDRFGLDPEVDGVLDPEVTIV